jgi:hypothetical protein
MTRSATRRLLMVVLVLLALRTHARADEPPAPFAFGDFTWMNGTSRQKDFPLALNKIIQLDLYLDVYYAFSLNRPYDDTLTGSATLGRHNELQINLASIGLTWSYRNVNGRIALQYGGMLSIVQDTDPSLGRGSGISTANLRYLREATLGYHWDRLAGINLDAGIFLSYVGMESYLLAENWLYTRTVACDSTPFYFQGLRAQIFPTTKVKVELWLMNGWQSYAKFGFVPAGGASVRWSPREWIAVVANFYLGQDTPNVSDRIRFHHDDSLNLRVYNRPASHGLSKLALSINNHGGFQAGGAGQPGPADAHMGASALSLRAWFARDQLALTVRGEYFTNPGRYLAPFPPPSLKTEPGNDLTIWGVTGNIDVMPTDFFSVRAEVNWRSASVPFFSGPDGVTSPTGFQPTPIGFVPNVRKSQTLLLVAANLRL